MFPQYSGIPAASCWSCSLQVHLVWFKKNKPKADQGKTWQMGCSTNERNNNLNFLFFFFLSSYYFQITHWIFIHQIIVSMENMAASTRNLLNLLKFTEFISIDGCTGTAGLSWKGKLDRSSLAAFFPWWAVNNCWNNLCWCLIFIKCLFLCAYICLTDCCDYSPVSQWPFHYTSVLNVSGHDHIYKKKKALTVHV